MSQARLRIARQCPLQRIFGTGFVAARSIEVGQLDIGRHEGRIDRDRAREVIVGQGRVASAEGEQREVHVRLATVGIVALDRDVFVERLGEGGTIRLR